MYSDARENRQYIYNWWLYHLIFVASEETIHCRIFISASYQKMNVLFRCKEDEIINLQAIVILSEISHVRRDNGLCEVLIFLVWDKTWQAIIDLADLGRVRRDDGLSHLLVLLLLHNPSLLQVCQLRASMRKVRASMRKGMHHQTMHHLFRYEHH